MKPAFEILANEQRITSVIEDRFVSMTIVDESGFGSDSCEIVLDNRDLAIKPPARGAELKVSLGYQETGVVKMGLFVVDEYEREGLPHQLVIRARSAFGGNGSKSETLSGIKAALKQQVTRSWSECALGKVVEQIAQECGLEARIDSELAARMIEHIDQTHESNQHFLQRLARERDVLFKVAGGCLIFVPKGKAASALGATLPTVNLTMKSSFSGSGLWAQVKTYRLTVAERDEYQSVVARYHDFEAAEQVNVTVGDGEPVRRLRKLYGSAEEAAEAAEAELRRIGRGNAAPSFGVNGTPELAAEGFVDVDDSMGSDLQGLWLISRVTHNVSRSGFLTDVECETGSKV